MGGWPVAGVGGALALPRWPLARAAQAPGTVPAGERQRHCLCRDRRSPQPPNWEWGSHLGVQEPTPCLSEGWGMPVGCQRHPGQALLPLPQHPRGEGNRVPWVIAAVPSLGKGLGVMTAPQSTPNPLP